MAQVRFQRIGDDYRLTFGEDEQSVSVTLDLEGARGLFFGLATTLAGLSEGEDPAPLARQPMLDVFSPTFQIGSDDEGRPVLGLQVDPLPPFHFRFEDRQAREIARIFLEIVDTPATIRTAKLLS